MYLASQLPREHQGRGYINKSPRCVDVRVSHTQSPSFSLTRRSFDVHTFRSLPLNSEIFVRTPLRFTHFHHLSPSLPSTSLINQFSCIFITRSPLPSPITFFPTPSAPCSPSLFLPSVLSYAHDIYLHHFSPSLLLNISLTPSPLTPPLLCLCALCIEYSCVY
jgi:hypothetical protein